MPSDSSGDSPVAKFPRSSKLTSSENGASCRGMRTRLSEGAWMRITPAGGAARKERVSKGSVPRSSDGSSLSAKSAANRAAVETMDRVAAA